MNAMIWCALTAFGVGDVFTEAKIAKAKIEVRTIAQAAEFFNTKNNKYPATLKELADANLFAPPGLPLDPWGNSYHYDLKGPRNGGKKPDVWVETPDKQVFGNWPDPNKKDK